MSTLNQLQQNLFDIQTLMFFYIMAILQTSENENERIHSSFLYKVNMRDLGYFSKHYYKFEEKNEK